MLIHYMYGFDCLQEVSAFSFFFPLVLRFSLHPLSFVFDSYILFLIIFILYIISGRFASLVLWCLGRTIIE